MRLFLYGSVLAVALTTPAWAKLPALSDEAKAKAAETVAKAAWADKVGLYKHCLVTDRIASAYRKTGTAATTPAAVAFATPVTPVTVSTTTVTSGTTAIATATATVAAGPGPVVIPPCADPGPFAMPVTPAVAKPLEAAGAHSPSGTAVSPPSTKATAAEMSADPKASPVTPVKDKPLEAAEAHSPPGTAVGPPSTNATNAELTGKSKK